MHALRERNFGEIWAALLLAGLASPALAAGAAPAAQPHPAGEIDYAIAFPNRAHHEADVTATFNHVPPGPLRIQMARSSPGRYRIHEFAKNVYSVSATDGAGRPLPIARTDPYGWTVETHDGTVRFHYTVFADRADGTYSQFNVAHEHISMPATFAFAPTLVSRPIALSLAVPEKDWQVATQLIPSANGSWRARNFQYFMDSPIEVAPLRERRWTVTEQGRSYVIRFMIHSPDSNSDIDRFAAMAERIYHAEVAMWGDVPRYDGGTYTFIADYEPYVTGDGMEHRNSASLSSKFSLAQGMAGHIESLAHELFHSWNVKRLRPAELEPFDFTRSDPTPSLWFAEGFTNYYGPLLERRAGVSDVDRYLENLNENLGGTITWTGRRYGSPMEMSLHAPFFDSPLSIDPVNWSTFITYYSYGQSLALALDLELRQRGHSLDEMMRLLWRTHGANQKSYTTDDLHDALAQVSGDRAFADRFFHDSIYGSQLPDFGPLLSQAGLTLRQAHPERPYLGQVDVAEQDSALVLKSDPEPGSPLYKAAIGLGDEIMSVDGKPIATEKDWNAALKAMQPGKPITLAVQSLGKKRTVDITPAADPSLEVVRDETIGKTPTPAQLAFRNAWLGPDGSMLPPSPKQN
jgi:predicted metalloprotease with PDZ domain